MDNLILLKSKLIEMLGWFHEFCEKNNLRYYALGGTMLGAARHQGFIPWDDDIDVGMPREDYEKLESLIGNKNISKYFFETIKTDSKDYFYPYGKIYDTTTTLVENRAKKFKRGIFIDVFPLDGIGDNKEEAIRNFKKLQPLMLLLTARVSAIRKGRSFYKNFTITLMRFIPSFIIDNKKLLINIDEQCRKFKFDKSRYVANLNGNWGTKEISTLDVFGKPTLYKFEDLLIFGVENYDTYLTDVYGDWRKLPPIEKRVTHHDFVYDLDSSYIKS